MENKTLPAPLHQVDGRLDAMLDIITHGSSQEVANAVQSLLFKVPQWIPTKDHMPPEGKLVLIHPAYGPICASWAKRDSKGRLGFYMYIGRKVTHWMELPAPPGDDAPSLFLPPIPELTRPASDVVAATGGDGLGSGGVVGCDESQEIKP